MRLLTYTRVQSKTGRVSCVRIIKDLYVDFRLSMIISMMGVMSHFPPRRAVHSGDHRTPTAESTC